MQGAFTEYLQLRQWYDNLFYCVLPNIYHVLCAADSLFLDVVRELNAQLEFTQLKVKTVKSPVCAEHAMHAWHRSAACFCSVCPPPRTNATSGFSAPSVITAC